MFSYIHLILGSVLLRIRLMFSRCRINTKIVRADTTIMRPISFKMIEIITVIIPVIMEDNETYFEKYKDVMKLTTITINNIGLIPKIMPPEVATAIPPLKRAKTGYV